MLSGFHKHLSTPSNLYSWGQGEWSFLYGTPPDGKDEEVKTRTGQRWPLVGRTSQTLGLHIEAQASSVLERSVVVMFVTNTQSRLSPH